MLTATFLSKKSWNGVTVKACVRTEILQCWQICFLAKVREKNPDVVATHCFCIVECWLPKPYLTIIKKLLDTFVKIVNFIKLRPLKLEIASTTAQRNGCWT